MKVITVETRPTRLALVFSTQATPRVIRRAFRLLGGRWGGVHDLLLSLPSNGELDKFDMRLLSSADPDLIVSIDPQLDDVDWTRIIRQADIQPFEVIRLRERMESRFPFSDFFAESPALQEEVEEEINGVLDVDRPGLTWKLAATLGLLPSDSTTRRIPPEDASAETQTPVIRSRNGLTAVGAGAYRWALFGPEDDIKLATHFWSLRALGARPTWRDPSALEAETFPLRRAVLHATTLDANRLDTAAARWSETGSEIASSRPELIANIPAGRGYFASLVQAVPEDGDQLFVSTPPPPNVGELLRTRLRGTAEILIASAEVRDPDGMSLTRDDASRELLDPSGQTLSSVRVTKKGIAGLQPITTPRLIAIPRISYRDAVAAPFKAAGYSIEPSDKGRYQQRSLQLAHGLRFLAGILRSQESARLLDLFFEHHLKEQPKRGYRRAVTYADLELRLREVLRARRKRLPKKLVERADRWLVEWSDALLERGLLVAGYVLACSGCAHRAWYRSDEVAQNYACERCTAHTHIPANAIRSFRLNEAFFQLRDHHGEVVTLLLATLRDEAQRSLLYLPEVVLTHPSSSEGEADVAALVDGSLIVAEAKSANSISKKEALWYRFVARKTNAKRLIFASTDRSRKLCSELACQKCRDEHGVFHRDYVWSDAAREQVKEARDDAQGHDIAVETFCYDSLVASQTGSKDELVSVDTLSV